MEKSAYCDLEFKNKLLEKKRRGVKEIIWKLNPSQVDFIEEKLNFQVEPYLYEIRTKTFCNVRNLDNLLKDMHYKNKKGKRTMVTKLSLYQREMLDVLEIKYRPYKYKIKMNM